ncbi:hypothetical protein D7X74_01470 [Corallococcus sp. CA047B]|uniref:hypothetical protein n=1 Tax=Corallococcus sp. CA047B TaxID=2316729 RepID=UPI000EEFB300|nr:hypothetical protein [Corallococcus sp. CA047B]RKH21377.1 hypothetical protein D7X74_01470 [Corallococcus sp. CA047B]
MQSIPYDPALVLGNLVDETVLKSVIAISEAAVPADDAQEALNSLILSKRSIDMTIQELTGMGIDPKDVIASSTKLGDQIRTAAVAYATASMKAQDDIIKAKADRAKGRAAVAVSASVESPIDYNRTQIKRMPLAADSIKMDAQYFSNDSNTQDASNTIATIKDYVSASTSFLGSSRSLEASSAAQKQASRQYQNHDIAGTLVITVGCTHKDAVLLAPFVIDPDKAIRAWNALFSGDQISTDHPEKLVTDVIKAKGDSKNELKLISGATYGSSFVGMVHILRSESTTSDQAMFSAAASLQATMKAGGWFANAEGGFGVSESFSNDVKRMMSLQQISSHCSIITMGSIPSIKSNMVKVGVKEFADFDPAAMMDKLATLQNATATDQDSVSAAAAAARTGNQMVQLQATQVKSVMSGLGDIDDGQNKMLDINTLMSAFEDYVEKALDGNIGVPINYYLKTLPKAALAHLWVAKYYPDYLAISEDDS